MGTDPKQRALLSNSTLPVHTLLSSIQQHARWSPFKLLTARNVCMAHCKYYKLDYLKMSIFCSENITSSGFPQASEAQEMPYAYFGINLTIRKDICTEQTQAVSMIFLLHHGPIPIPRKVNRSFSIYFSRSRPLE